LRDGSIFLDSESRSASAALFVQGIAMRISWQDMESAVYQRGHARFRTEGTARRRSRVFPRAGPFRWGL